MKELADTYNCALIDMITPFSDKVVSLGYVSNDNIHPSASGQRLIYMPLENILIPTRY
jgi:lysophospholipase L1-like esterase